MLSKIGPRQTPDRDSRYMGLAWIQAAFSKDPSTQVGAVVIDGNNKPLGSGYNGPPSNIDDDKIDWKRPSKEEIEESKDLNKYDVMVHAELNAIDHCFCSDLAESTIYVTAMPCPACMLEIVRKKVKRVVYMDYQSSKTSSLQNEKWRAKSVKIANEGKVKLEKFEGNINWISDWNSRLNELGLFEMPK